jgi:hypothetical protein
MRINDPTVVAELTELHAVYEKALIANDVAILDASFWDSPHAVRYGVMENLHGAEEIRAFRHGRPSINLDRTIMRLEILAIGDNAGIVNVEFVRPINGIERSGRQTQFWFRFAEGWRIASAHVSLLPAAPSYLEAASAQLRVPVDALNRAAVSQDLNRLGDIANFLMEFPLSHEIEAAPVFRP